MSLSSTQRVYKVATQHDWRLRLPRLLGRGGLYLVATAIAISALLPFVWTISTSLKDGRQVLAIPPQWIPKPAHPENYLDVIRTEFKPGQKLFLLWTRNTIFISVLNVLGELLSCAAAGYGFARFRFKGRDTLFMIMLASALLPWVVRIVPLYMLFHRLHWIDTYYPLIVPYWFAGVTWTFFFRQYFATIPKELDDAAKMDGASSFQIFLWIMLPLSKPVLATAAILNFGHNWNRFLEPLIFLNSAEKFVLGVGLRWFQLQGEIGGTKEPLMSAYALIMAAPIIIIFFLGQRYFVRGIQLSASKE